MLSQSWHVNLHGVGGAGQLSNSEHSILFPMDRLDHSTRAMKDKMTSRGPHNSWPRATSGFGIHLAHCDRAIIKILLRHTFPKGHLVSGSPFTRITTINACFSTGLFTYINLVAKHNTYVSRCDDCYFLSGTF